SRTQRLPSTSRASSAASRRAWGRTRSTSRRYRPGAFGSDGMAPFNNRINRNAPYSGLLAFLPGRLRPSGGLPAGRLGAERGRAERRRRHDGIHPPGDGGFIELALLVLVALGEQSLGGSQKALLRHLTFFGARPFGEGAGEHGAGAEVTRPTGRGEESRR